MLKLFIVFLFLLALYLYLNKNIVYFETRDNSEYSSIIDDTQTNPIDINRILIRPPPNPSPTRSLLNDAENDGTVYINGDISTFLPSKVPYKNQRIPLVEYGYDAFEPYNDNYNANKYSINHAAQVEFDKENRIVARR